MDWRKIKYGIYLIFVHLKPKFIYYSFLFLLRIRSAKKRKELNKLSKNVFRDAMRVHQMPVKEIRDIHHLEEIKNAMEEARNKKWKISIGGSLHSCDGQQFSPSSLVLNMKPLNKILHYDEVKGLLTAESGTTWTDVIEYLAERKSPWGVIIKQTLVNSVSLGGGLGCNFHGIRFGAPPFIHFIHEFSLVNSEGNLITCNREENEELFRLAVGGFGLFGVVYSITIKLQPVINLDLDLVKMIPMKDIFAITKEKIQEGYLYGDFHSMAGFFSKGLASITMFKPAKEQRKITCDKLKCGELRMALYQYLVFERVADIVFDVLKGIMNFHHWDYNTTTCQYSDHGEYYEDIFNDILGYEGYPLHQEYHIPPEEWVEVLPQVQKLLGSLEKQLYYCDMRFVAKDNESFLRYATTDRFTFALLFVVRKDNFQQIKEFFNKILDLVIQHNGTFYLWDQFLGTPEHFVAAYPQIGQFVNLKRKYDPNELFYSQWYQQILNILNATSGTNR